ncbi:MAG: undecaprenyl-phosphate glucose phosphotransferase [bacterium]|nr:undecaprenyl-phosphate glucose phosphotransferase [bacterium]
MPRRSHTTEIATAVRVALDVILLNAAFCAAYWIRFRSPLVALIPVYKGTPPFLFYLKAFPVATLVFVYMYKALGSYPRRWRDDPMNEFFLLTRGTVAGMLVLMAITFLLPSTHSPEGLKYSRITFLLIFPLIEAFLLCGRLAARAIERRLQRASRGKRKILVIGTGETAARLARHIGRTPSLEREIVGFLACPGERRSSSRIIDPVLGNAAEAGPLIERGGIDEVILTVANMDHDAVMDIVLACGRNLVEFRHVPGMFELMTKQVDVVNLDGVPLVGLHHIPLHYPWNRFVKRCLDVAGAAAGLLLSAPIIAAAGAAIRIESAGPVFFAQERVGEDGRRFRLYKLRTMVPGAERETGPVWAKANDPRCTRVGAFLRRHNIDELPQFLNVLRGDMSLVGPRPERPHFVRRFKEDIPRYMSRHLVRSGMTGWAQVNGLRGDTSLKARLRYDMHYLENWSVLFDLKILLMTLFARRNAY